MPARSASGRRGHDRLVRQGPDAAGRDGVGMLDPIKNKPIGAGRGVREVRRAARQGGGRPGAVRRLRSTTCRACRASASRPPPQLINEYGDLDTLLARAGEIKQPKRRADADRQSPTRRGCRAAGQAGRATCRCRSRWTSWRSREPDPKSCWASCEQQGFRTIIARSRTDPRRRQAGRGAAAAAPRHRRGQACRRPRRRRPPETSRAPSSTASAAMSWSTTLRGAGRLDRAGLRRRRGRLRHRDRQPDRAAAPSCSASRWRWRRARPATSRSAMSAPAARRPKARSSSMPPTRRRRSGRRGHGAAEAAAGGPDRPEGRPERQVRHGRSSARTASRWRPIDDTMLITYVLEAGLHGHGMDELSKLHLRPQADHLRSRWPAPARRRVSFKHVRAATRRPTTPPRTPT